MTHFSLFQGNNYDILPEYWCGLPEIQTMDHVKFPGNYGYGSSTVRLWIRDWMKIDDIFKRNGPWQVPDGASATMITCALNYHHDEISIIQIVGPGQTVTTDYRTDRVRMYVEDDNDTVQASHTLVEIG